MIPVDEYSGSTMGNLPIGQGLSVTPMQMAAAYSAIADDGVLHAPRLVLAEDGQRIDEDAGKRVISSKDAAEIRTMLEGVRRCGWHGRGGQRPGLHARRQDRHRAEGRPRDRYLLRDRVTSPRSSASPRPRTRGCWSRSSSTTRRATTTAAPSRRRPSARSPSSRCRISRSRTHVELPRIGADGASRAARRRRRRSRSIGDADAEITGPRLRQPPGGPGHPVLRDPGVRPPTATTSRRYAVQAGATAIVVERRLDLEPFVIQAIVGDARAAMAHAAARFYGDPTAELRVVGITGTNGKTTTAFLVRHILEAPGRPHRPARHRQARGRRRGRGGRAHDARGDRPAGDVPAHGRRRRPRLRDGGLVARAQPQPRRRDPVRRRRVHEPDPGSPRLPRRHGGLLPRQAPAVRGRASRAADREPRRPVRRQARGGVRHGDVLGGRRRARRSARPRPALRRRRLALSAARPPTARSTSSCRCPAASTSRTHSARSPARWPSGSGSATRSRRSRPRPTRSRPLRARRRGPAVRGPRRLRAHPRLARERARVGARRSRPRAG